MNASDVHSVRRLHGRYARAILGLGQPKRLVQVIEDQDPPATAGAPDSKDEVTFHQGSPLHPRGRAFFVSKGGCFVSTQTAALPAIRTHLRPAEVAARTGLSKSAVFHALYTGSLRATRVGRAWVISTAAIDEWLDDSGRHAA